MASNTPVLNSVAAAPPARPEAPSLDEVLARIAVDSKNSPENYLSETEVPHGGE